MRVDGACHCGNLSFILETRQARETIAPRACDCGFCMRHGARCWSDPEGRVTIVVREDALLQRYRFGERTADFLVCERCGVYLGAMIEANGAARATVNLRLTTLCDLPATSVSYGGESREGRIARRLARWTPASVEFGSEPAPTPAQTSG
jgi:hypothetical protein